MSYTAFNNFVNSAALGWKECEKENYFYPLNHTTSTQASAPIMQTNIMAPSLSSSFYQQGSISPTPASTVPVIKSELDTLVTFLAKFDSKVAAIWGSGENEQEEAKKRMIDNNNMMMLMMMNGSQSQVDNGNGHDGRGVIGEKVWGQPLSSTEVSPPLDYKISLDDYQDNNNNEKEIQDLKLDDDDDDDDDDMIVDEDLLTSAKTHFKPIETVEMPSYGLWSLEDPTEYATYKRTADSTFPLRFKIRNENDKAVQTDYNYNYSSSFGTNTSPWVTTSASSSFGFGSDEEDGVSAATDKLYLW